MTTLEARATLTNRKYTWSNGASSATATVVSVDDYDSALNIFDDGGECGLIRLMVVESVECDGYTPNFYDHNHGNIYVTVRNTHTEANNIDLHTLTFGNKEFKFNDK